jgi:uncharacterized SAM-binding protein YcdF (DUF218 family)
VYRLGGAQAIAALAYGTESVPRVDKIVGPGSAWVVIAMAQVFGEVGIASLPGPTETLVVADGHADPEHVAADLLAQAEHDGAEPVLVTIDAGLWPRVEAAIERRLATLPTAATARESLERRGAVVFVDDLPAALEVANAYAPEHLCLLVRDPWSWVGAVRHAGGLFVGETSLEALGDYAAGPSHVMPTGGTARFSSAINVRDFQRVLPLIGLSQAGVDEIGAAAALLARAEGLEAHAQAEARARGPLPGRRIEALALAGAAQYDGVPSAAFERRLAGALSLAEAGCAPQVVVSGGRRERDRLSEGEAGVVWLSGRGAEAVLVAETRATSTVENLRFSAELARVPRWIVVTDDLHAPRTRFAAARLGLEAEVVGVRTERGRWPYAWREVLGMLAYRLGALR